MTIFVLFLTFRYCDKGVDYSFITLSVWFWLSKTPKRVLEHYILMDETCS